MHLSTAGVVLVVVITGMLLFVFLGRVLPWLSRGRLKQGVGLYLGFWGALMVMGVVPQLCAVPPEHVVVARDGAIIATTAYDEYQLGIPGFLPGGEYVDYRKRTISVQLKEQSETRTATLMVGGNPEEFLAFRRFVRDETGIDDPLDAGRQYLLWKLREPETDWKEVRENLSAPKGALVVHTCHERVP